MNPRALGMRLLRTEAAAAATEFAFVAPVFLMFLFLLLEGGRMIFTKQALNELAFATARCAAVQGTGCTSKSAAESWAVAHSQLSLTSSMVNVTTSGSCNSQSGMAVATITMPWQRGAMALLPERVAPSQLVASACFPVSPS